MFSTYDSHSELCEAISLIRGYRKNGWGYFLRAESFLTVAQKQFRPGGLYLLDEPEAKNKMAFTLAFRQHRCK